MVTYSNCDLCREPSRIIETTFGDICQGCLDAILGTEEETRSVADMGYSWVRGDTDHRPRFEQSIRREDNDRYLGGDPDFSSFG